MDSAKSNGKLSTSERAFRGLILALMLLGILTAQAAAGTYVQATKLVGVTEVGGSTQGFAVAMSGDGSTLAVGAEFDKAPNGGPRSGSCFVYTFGSDSGWTQQAKLFPSTPLANAWFGDEVALSQDGNTLLVGSPGDGSTGAAYWYYRCDSQWLAFSKLVGSGSVGTAGQGTAVALSRDGLVAVVGGSYDNNYKGAVWVYVRDGLIVTALPKLAAPNDATANPNVYFGTSVAANSDGTVIAIGGGSDNAGLGATWIYTRSGTTLTETTPILHGSGSSGNARQGVWVTLSPDGKTCWIGADLDNLNGAFWEFKDTGSGYEQQGGKYTLPDPISTGNSQYGRRFGFRFAISVDGTKAVINAPYDNGMNGSVRIYAKSGSTWTLTQTMIGSGIQNNGPTGHELNMGYAVSANDDLSTFVAGVPYDGNDTGAALIFNVVSSTPTHSPITSTPTQSPSSSAPTQSPVTSAPTQSPSASAAGLTTSPSNVGTLAGIAIGGFAGGTIIASLLLLGVFARRKPSSKGVTNDHEKLVQLEAPPEEVRKTQFDVFISHKSEDRAAPEKLYDFLTKKYVLTFRHGCPSLGLKVFVDYDHADHGQLDLGTLMDKVKASKVVVLILSKGFFRKPWCVAEALTACKEGIPLVTVELPGFNRDVEFAELNHLDEIVNQDSGLKAEFRRRRIDPVEATYYLSQTLPLLILKEFDPTKGRSMQQTMLNNIYEAMKFARSRKPQVSPFEWIHERDALRKNDGPNGAA